MRNKTLLIISFILTSVIITISAIITHVYICIVQICLTIKMLNSIRINYHISVYYRECLAYLCCIISLLSCIYCTLLANNTKLDEIKKLEERIFLSRLGSLLNFSHVVNFGDPPPITFFCCRTFRKFKITV